MRKFCHLLIAVFLIILTCAQKEEKIIGEQGGMMTIGTSSLPKTLSPLAPSIFGSNDVLNLLFMHLHRIDPETGKMKPELASSWEFSEDFTSITYHLRDDVTWWDGTPVTADDVYYTYEKMKDPKTYYPDIVRLRFIKDVEIVSTYGIKFTFDRIYADLLTDSDIMAVPKHVCEKLGDTFGRNPIGNGPYKIKEWTPGSRLVLTANDAYYRGKPPLDEIHIKYYLSPRKMMEDFVNGDLDLILNITPILAKDLENEEHIVIDSRPGNTYTYVGWNLSHPYLKDDDVREALSMAIDKNRILNEVFAGIGSISLGPLPQSSWGYNKNIKPIEYDVSKAREILQRAGFEDRNLNRIFDKNGRDFTLDIITNTENPERVAILDFIARDLRTLGIMVRTRTLSTESFIEAIINKKFDGFIMGWNTDEKIDPTVYWHSDPAKGIFNFVSYKNSIVDSLIDEGVAMLNRNKAKRIWNEFQKIIYEDRPYTFLIVANDISSCHKWVKGVDKGIVLGNAHIYWISGNEKRVSIASLTRLAKQETITITPALVEQLEETTTVKPEELLEAAVKKETTVVAATIRDTTRKETLITLPTPPKPSIITRAVPTKKVTPKYPQSARAIGTSGRVVIRVLIGTNGKVKETTILSSFGNPACEAAALDAAKQWEFEPATKDGIPFEQKATIPFDFKPLE